MSDVNPRTPNVFTVPPGRPFLQALATAIVAGDLPQRGGARPDPIDLPTWTILLPTRRAARVLQDAFLAAAGNTAMLLPAIRAIGDGQEDLDLIESAAGLIGGAADALAIPPAIGGLERTLLLTHLVEAWSRATRTSTSGSALDADGPVLSAGASSPAQAARLAAELARLIDAVETENVSLVRIADLVPAEFSEHWAQTLDFLKIITELWPAYLAEQGLLSPADRRNRLVLAEAQRIRARPPPAPLIVAGVTGSVPATAELIGAIAALETGAVVLPGLDLVLEPDVYARIAERHPEHPQHGLSRLLAQIGMARDDVTVLAGAEATPRQRARNRLVTEILRPTGSLSGWRALKHERASADLAGALDGVSLIEAASAEEEAEAVSLILREALETPGQTAALVSPDRLLARRVATRLEAWGIRVDDSAGRPFAKTVPGAFLEAVARAAQSGFAPAELMALLKHPLTRLGLDAGTVRRAARNLELVAFRTTYLGRGLGSVGTAVETARMLAATGERREAGVRRMRDPDWELVHDLVRRLVQAFEPMVALEAGKGTVPISALVRAHVETAEAVALKPTPPAPADGEDTAEPEPCEIWAREEGAAAALLMARLMNGDVPQPSMRPADYADMLRTLVGSESIRTRVPRHPRLFIWGPYESRLQQTDVVVLGSLNEGVWPKTSDPGPWLSRGMRAELGLSSPEEETGRAAHDLTQLLGTRRVVLTRAQKVGGVPMVASRWLLRAKALFDGLGLTEQLVPDRPWLGYARARDVAPKIPAIRQPAPRPPVASRPRRASVSEVETWLANPYAVFARRVLGLEALPALGQEPGPAERGQIVHAALAEFTAQHPDALPDDIAEHFMAAADKVIGRLAREPRVAAFWRPRLVRFAQWFAETEAGRRAEGSRRLTEIGGKMIVAAPNGPFELIARADRIDIEPRGLVITDYKTGKIPTNTEVGSGFAPQLPLEAAMAAAGMFPGVEARTVAALRYIRATGGEPPGEDTLVSVKDKPPGVLAAEALANLELLIAKFDDPATPYLALRRRKFDYTYDDYAHLARLGEWSED